MTNWTTLPYERLLAYQEARALLLAVREAQISDPELRDQALRAAKSACLNTAEAAGRVSPADQKRVFGIARGETSEAAAAVDIALASGECRPEAAAKAGAHALRAYALLSGLIRRVTP
jgi:four helix bundle protein